MTRLLSLGQNQHTVFISITTLVGEKRGGSAGKNGVLDFFENIDSKLFIDYSTCSNGRYMIILLVSSIR